MYVYMCQVFCFHGGDVMYCVGGKLLPDYFLDDAEDFQTEWLESTQAQKSSAAAETNEAASDTPAAVFKIAQSLITPDVVQKVNSTFLFVVEGEHPGEHFVSLCSTIVLPT